MSEERYTRHNEGKDKMDMIDLVISALLQHEKQIDELEQRFDDQLLRLRTLTDKLCDLTDEVERVLKRPAKE